MKLFVNEDQVDTNQVQVNSGLNYGRFDHEGIIIDNYRLQISKNKFIELIEADYNRIRDEIKIDDERYKDSSEFELIDYASIDELISNKSFGLPSIIMTYLDRILFSKLFQDCTKGHFIINSTDNVEVKVDKIEISGRTFRKLET